jgi:hypothetical protein
LGFNTPPLVPNLTRNKGTRSRKNKKSFEKNTFFKTFFLDIQNKARYTVCSGGIGAGRAL